MILGKNLIPKFRWTTGKTSSETETGVPAGKWVWKVEVFGTGQNGEAIVMNTFESIYLNPKPQYYSSETEADVGAEKFIDEKLKPPYEYSIFKALGKRLGIK